MPIFTKYVAEFANIIWGQPLSYIILGMGLYLTITMLFPQIRFLYHGIRVIIGKYIKPLENEKAGISNFDLFCKIISAPIGLGSVAGVAIGISVGGPGAVFWMWVAGIVGMATKFTSITLSVIFHSKSKHGDQIETGPMHIIKNGLGSKYNFLAISFCILTILGSIFAGNMFQTNQMAVMLKLSTGLPPYIAGILFTILTGLALFKSKKLFQSFIGKIAPIIILLYLVCCLGIIISNIESLQDVIFRIFHDAFTGTAVLGGTVAVTFREVITHGVRRALFSNEAGMGSAAMAVRTLKNRPAQQGIVGMFGPLIDTIIVCSLTAFVILIKNPNAFGTGMHGVELTAQAFSAQYGNIGEYIITLLVILFAFSNILTWSFYGERAIRFMFGNKFVKAYFGIFTLLVFLGTVLDLELILNLADPIIGLMVIPNIIANIILSKKAKNELKKYKIDLKAERI